MDDDLASVVKANDWQQDRPDGLISLVKAERLAEQEEFDGLLGDEEEPETDASEEDEEEDDRRDAQLEEALNIVSDLAELTG